MSAGERLALDTNVLIYALDEAAGERHRRAAWLVRRAVESGRAILSVQNIGEFYVTAVRRGYLEPAEAAQRAGELMAMFRIVEPTAGATEVALQEAAAGRFSYWDGLLLATLANAGCTALLSEDMSDGAALLGVTVRDSFAGEELPGTVVVLLGLRDDAPDRRM